jgi:hypothetical protein
LASEAPAARQLRRREIDASEAEQAMHEHIVGFEQAIRRVL